MKSKLNIRSNFNKAAATYDQYCKIQNEICDYSIEMLLHHDRHFDYIADIACGTGESTKKLIQTVRYNQCVAIDFSENLLIQAKKKLNNNAITFICSDFDFPIFKKPFFDLIFCNMGLQWSFGFYKTIGWLHQYLLTNGWLLFSLPLSDNFPEIHSDFKLELLGHESIIRALNDQQFILAKQDKISISNCFFNPIEVLRSLKRIGANYSKSKAHHAQSGLSRINIKKIFVEPASTQLTYNIGIYLAVKS